MIIDISSLTHKMFLNFLLHKINLYYQKLLRIEATYFLYFNIIIIFQLYMNKINLKRQKILHVFFYTVKF